MIPGHACFFNVACPAHMIAEIPLLFFSQSKRKKCLVMKNICVIGLGYIGLPTAALFASRNFEVLGVDIDPRVIETIRQGKIHLEEPGLKTLIKDSLKKGTLRVSSTPAEADIFIIAVPTPVYEDKRANLEFVKQAVRDIIPFIKQGDTMIIESTIPPRTTDDVIVPMLQKAGFDPKNNDLYVAHCPERVIPGKILIELVENHRMVGGVTREAAKRASEVYKPVINGKIIETEAMVAETAKLMENTYRDVNIALANELAKIAARLNINAHEVIELANMHPRVNILEPGPGVGGHCIAVDPYFMIEKAKDVASLIQTARKINDSMPTFVVEKVKQLTSRIANPKIAILGLTYKGNVDDTRESPALTIVHKLMTDKHNYTVKCHDPLLRQEHIPLKLYGLHEALEDTHLALVLADHQPFKQLHPSVFVETMKHPIIFDTKNCIADDPDITLYKIGHLSGLKPIEP